MQEAKRLAVITVVWNHRDALARLLSSLDKQDERDFQTVVIDNASTDGVSAALQQTHPEIVTFRNFKNLGLAHALNQGICLALGRWSDDALDDRFVAIVEPDVLLAPDALSVLVRALTSDPSVMIAGPKIVRAGSEPREESDEPEIVPTKTLESAGLILTKTRRFFDRGRGEADQGQFDARREVFGVSGGCALFRASALKRLELCDEWLDADLPPGQEVWDLMWRARVLGMPAQFVPEAVAWRIASALKNGPASERRRRNYERARLIWKNDFGVNRFLHATWIFLGALKFFFVALFHPGLAVSAIGSWKDRLRMRAKRRALMKSPHLSAKEMRLWFL